MSNEKPLSGLLKAFAKTYQLEEKLRHAQVQEIWAKTMGPSLNARTRRLELQGGELTIYADSASFRQELSLGKDNILRILNEGLGGDFIKSVIIR